MRIDTMFNQAQAHLTEYYDDHRLFDPLLLLLPQDTCNASIYIYIFVWFTSFYTPFFFTRSRSFWHAIIISIFRKQIMFNIRLFCTYVQNIYDWCKHRFLSNFHTRSIYFRLCRSFATTKPVLKPKMEEKSEKSLNIHVKNPF